MIDYEIFMNSRRLRHIRRCNNFPCLLQEDVAQHSYFVTLLSKIFVEEYNSFAKGFNWNLIDKAEVLEKALCHDWDEAFISDIPYVVKHITPEVHDSLCSELDKKMDNLLGHGTSRILWENCKTCKDGLAGVVVAICDMLELAIYCYEECNLGNKALEPILKNCIHYLDSMKATCLDSKDKRNTLDYVMYGMRGMQTIRGLYDMIKSYKFCEDNIYVDIESHE